MAVIGRRFKVGDRVRIESNRQDVGEINSPPTAYGVDEVFIVKEISTHRGTFTCRLDENNGWNWCEVWLLKAYVIRIGGE